MAQRSAANVSRMTVIRGRLSGRRGGCIRLILASTQHQSLVIKDGAAGLEKALDPGMNGRTDAVLYRAP